MAPASESTPPTIQARYTSHAEPTACIISAGTRKIPLPMMVPTTTALAWLTPRSRESEGTEVLLVCGICGICDIVQRKQKTGTIPDDKRNGATDQHIPGEGNRAR